MPGKKVPASAQDPTLQLKILALRDDRLVHNYRDIHYQLIIDSLQASGQRIASRERVAPLSDTRYKRLMKQYASLRERICKKYKISGFHGGDPYIVKKDGWLATIQVSLNKRLMVETNWQTSFFAPAIRFHGIPENAKVYPSESGTIYQLPDLPKRPQTSPCMTIHLDLSQVKPNALAPLTEEFKEAVKQCLAELPQSHRKPPSAWEQISTKGCPIVGLRPMNAWESCQNGSSMYRCRRNLQFVIPLSESTPFSLVKSSPQAENPRLGSAQRCLSSTAQNIPVIAKIPAHTP
jgi:hypothetical protein